LKHTFQKFEVRKIQKYFKIIFIIINLIKILLFSKDILNCEFKIKNKDNYVYNFFFNISVDTLFLNIDNKNHYYYITFIIII